MTKKYQNKNEWLEAAREAATGINAGNAHRHASLWKRWMGEDIRFPQKDQYLEGLRQNLLITAFPVLSSERANYVLRYLTKQFFSESEYQLAAIQKIEDRITAAGEGLYEEERLNLYEALKTSIVPLGNFVAADWFTQFEEFQKNGEATLAVFTLQNPHLEGIPNNEKQIVITLLDVYENFLAFPILTIAEYLYSKQERGDSLSSEKVSEALNSGSVEKLTLLKALSKYSDIGSQVITTDRVKLKGQTEPVRGSITNWLKVYRDELGIGRHDAVTRAQFLYESINTKKLPPEDREKVHALVRSLEDEELLAIDIKTRSLIFFEEKKIPQQTFQATQIAGNKAATEGAPQDLFERFAGTSSPMQSATQPRLEPRTKPANTLPTPLYGVGTSKFGAVTQRPEKTREEELGLLERIKKMKTARLPEIPPHEREPGESLPLGKLTFSGSQVFSGEKAKQPSVSPQTMMVAPDSSPSTMLVADQERTPSWSNQKPTPPHAISVQAFPQKRIAPLAPEAQPVASKRVSSPASVFRIKPNRE
jgi:hypothetical protein